MFDTLITNKTRIKLLIRFFLNANQTAYLRGLERELGNSSNAIRLELNRFEDAGLLTSETTGNRKEYRANPEYPLYGEIQSMVMKYFGIDTIVEEVIARLGDLKAVYLTGDLAKGQDSRLVDIALVAEDVDRAYLSELVVKAEKQIKRSIRTLVIGTGEENLIPSPRVLIYGDGGE